MSKTIRNFYTVRPDALEIGDVMICVVACHVMNKTPSGELFVQLYRGEYPPRPGNIINGIPQGSRVEINVLSEHYVARMLFPVLSGMLVYLEDLGDQ